MPVFYFRRDVYNISGFQLLCLFAPFLIIAPSACYKEDLTAFVMDMPLLRHPGSKVTLPTPTLSVVSIFR